MSAPAFAALESQVDKLNQVVSVRLEHATVRQALQHIAGMGDLKLIYREEVLASGGAVSLDLEQVTVLEALHEAVRDTGLRLQLTPSGHLIIIEKPAAVQGPETEPSALLLQTGAVAGRVLDAATGEGIPGANVVIAGTTLGGATDLDGNYRIGNLDPGTYTLQASFIGYKPQEVSGVPVVADEVTELDFTLEEDVAGLEEVVVVGYGTLQRRDLTGSVASVSAEEIQEVPVTSFDQALQGRVPGVQVTQGSASPGGGVSVRIRGNNSIRSDNEPLYVVDGIPVNMDNISVRGAGTQAIRVAKQNPLAGLNPNDIESIEVLKDASATAIYGSRGANGVVLVTTKRGRPGAARLEYNAYTGIQQAARAYELLNAQEYAELVNEARVNDGQDPLFGNGDARFESPELLGGGTNWQGEIFQPAPMQNHQLSVSGGSESVRYYVSGNYFNQEGVLVGSGYQRGGVRTNVDIDVTDDFRLGTKVLAAHTIRNRSITGGGGIERGNGALAGALAFPPTVSVYGEDGSFASNDIPNGAFIANPVSVVEEIENRQISDRILGSAFAEYALLEGLTLKLSLATEIFNSRINAYAPSTSLVGSFYGGIAGQSSIRNTSWLSENTLSYVNEFGGKHRLNVVAGFTAEEQVLTSIEASALEFVSDVFGSNALGLGALPVEPESDKRRWGMLSWLGRANYALLDRYLFTVTARADGSSKFGASNKWGFFPSAAVAWRLSDEPFMEGVHLFDDFKLRASYGLTGNSGSPYQSLAALRDVYYIFNDGLAPGFTAGGVANPGLQWETTAITNVGFDAAFADSRLLLTAEYYYKKTEDLLLHVPVAPASGFTSALMNAGSLQNRGLELALGVVAVDRPGLTWNLNGNVSLNRTKVLSLAGSDEMIIDGTLVREGAPLGQWYGYVFDGVYQTEEQLANGPLDPGADVGDARYLDVNGDGTINADDRIVIGDANPDLIYGLSSDVTYKNFDLNVFVHGVYGANVRNETLRTLATINPFNNQVRELALRRWTPTNTDTDVPRASFGNNNTGVFSSRYIEDGTYLRIKNITLGYTLPLRLRNMRQARVYFGVQNPIIFTDYSGYDPEVNASGSNIVFNVDDFSYPMARSYTLGVNLTL